LLSQRQLRRRRDQQGRAEDKSNRERATNGGSPMDHAVAPEEAWYFEGTLNSDDASHLRRNGRGS
jgi:hypothetical protein